MPPAAPADWHRGPPDFVGVGAQRSGSTWWYGLVLDHPDVVTAGGKERHFFDPLMERPFTLEDARAYHRSFPRPFGSITGEWTPRYMYDPWTPPLLARAAPEAKLLVILRDPLSRFRSGLEHEAEVFKWHLRGRRKRHLLTMIVNDELQRSLYARQLGRLLEHFDRDRVLILQYERCTAEPLEQIRRTYEFLRLDPDHRPELPERPASSRELLAAPEHLVDAVGGLIRRDLDLLGELVPELEPDRWASWS